MFSIPLCLIFYTGIILGGVAIVLAILSKGIAKTFLPQAKKAIILGSVGVVLGYFMMITSIHTVLTDPEQRQQLNIMSEQMYGTSFDEMLNDIKLR